MNLKTGNWKLEIAGAIQISSFKFPVSAGGSAHAQAAIAPFPLLKIDDGLEQIFLGEVRPQSFRDPKFRVGDLPEKKITEAQLTAGANQQVGVRQTPGIKVVTE